MDDAYTGRQLASHAVGLLQADLEGWDLAELARRLGVEPATVRAALESVLEADLDTLRERLVAERDAALGGAVLLAPAAPRPLPVAVDDVPAGLEPEAVVEHLGPLRGNTVVLSSVGPVAVTRALWSLVRQGEPVSPYSMGVLTRAWGRGEGTPPMRCLRLLEQPGTPGAGRQLWSHPGTWYATFRYAGSMTGIDPACTWLAARWVPRAGLRLGYGPLLALVEGIPDWRGRVRASVHLSVADLPTS